MLSVAAFAHFAGVYRHRLVALGVIAHVMNAFASIVTISGVAVARYLIVVWILHLRAFLFCILKGVDGRLSVLVVGRKLSE